MLKLITDCWISGTGIFLSLKSIKNSKSIILTCISIFCLVIYVSIAFVSIGSYLNKKKTKKAIDSFSK